MSLPTRVVTPPVDSLPLDRDQVMRLLGYQPGKTVLTPVITPVLERGIALGLAAARPAISLAYCSVHSISDGTVRLTVPGLAWKSSGLARLLREAPAVSLVAATLGPGIEEKVRQLFAEQDYATATVVDATGTVLIQSLVRHAEALVDADAGEIGCKATPAFCPGYADWDLYDQPALVAQAGGAAIGLTCTASCYLNPQKSMAGIIGWTAASARLPASGCSACSLTSCAYRKVNVV